MQTEPPTVPPASRPNLRHDFASGLVVFVVALPLCLGIALASDAPLMSGIIAGIVGGIVVGVVSGSHTSISGPAAGLSAVVASQIAQLGSFQAFLLAVVFAGVLQVGLGVLRAGTIGNYVPASVVRGLLAAIGLILIFKQIPHLLGHDADPEGEMSFIQPDGETTASEFLRVMDDFHWGATVIGLTSLLLLLAWPRIKWLARSPIPSAIGVVSWGVALNETFGVIWPGGQVSTAHLVNVPTLSESGGAAGLLLLPDFTQLTNPAVYVAATVLGLVASLEAVLNVEASDKLDPKRRVSPLNRELLAQGAGNIVSGMLGGLPVTSEIVRSSVNVGAGAHSKLSAIIHGVLLVSCVGMFPDVLNHIPLAALAAILIMTGSRLANPKIFREMWQRGSNVWVPFVGTTLAILATDLLVGVIAGICMAVLFLLKENLTHPIRRYKERHARRDTQRVELPSHVSFLNRSTLSNTLSNIPPGGHVIIDGSRTHYVDPDIEHLLQQFVDGQAAERGVTVSIQGLPQPAVRMQSGFMMRQPGEYPDGAAAPDRILESLLDGNQRHRGSLHDLPQPHLESDATAEPIGLAFCHSPTPVDPARMFDLPFGKLDVYNGLGGPDWPQALERFEEHLREQDRTVVLTVGHSPSEVTRQRFNAACQHAANDGATERSQDNAVPRHLLEDWAQASPEERDILVDELTRQQLVASIERLLAHSRRARVALREGRLIVAAVMYAVDTGHTDLFYIKRTERSHIEASPADLHRAS